MVPMAFDLYQTITDKIISLLDQGTVPWRRPIRRTAAGDGFPKSMATGKPYRGINVFLLAATSWIKGYDSSYWATFNQVKETNASVRKGEKSTLVVFWKEWTVEDKNNGEEKKVPLLRHFNVFNAEQCEGLKAPDAIVIDGPPPPPFVPLDECERIIAGYANPPTIEHGGSRACYLPREDKIEIAKPERFVSGEDYYATLFHEVAHSTGHERRLNRQEGMASLFGDENYSKEELVAELGAAFLAATAGISPPTIDNAAAYIRGWSKAFKEDKKLIVSAAGAAQRAADHVLGVTFANAPEPSP